MSNGLSPDLKRRIDEFEYWHYEFELGPGVRTDVVRSDYRRRHDLRLQHVMKALLPRTGGSLSGLRVLDVGCNAGFWSFHARRQGAAYVLGIDRFAGHIKQARLVQEALSVDGIDFKELDIFDITPASIGQFDVVLFLGVLYHLDRPLSALRILREVTSRHIVVDTFVLPIDLPIAEYSWETDAMRGLRGSLVEVPSRSALLLMLEHSGFGMVEVATADSDMPEDYRSGHRITCVGDAVEKAALTGGSPTAALGATIDARYVQDTILSRASIMRFIKSKLRRRLASIPNGPAIETALKRVGRRLRLY